MSFGEAVRSVLSQYTGFTGRARRREFWNWCLALLLAEVVIGILWSVSDTLGLVLFGVFWLAILLPSIAVAIRRLHDTDRSGWWLLLGLVPLGGLVLIVFYVLDGTPGANQYGLSPKSPGAQAPAVP